MALTKITPQMFDTSATAHDLNVDNGTFVVDGSASRVGIGTATPSTLLDVNGALTATTIAGTLTTAAQTNITSVGTLTSLTLSGDLTIADKIVHSGDTDTFFRFAGANDIRIVAGNVEHAAFDGTIVFNQSAADMDFRVESTGNASMLHVDAGNDRVGIGTNSPGEMLHVSSSSSTAVKITGNFPQLLFEDTAGSDLDAYIVNNANGLFFGKTNSPTASNDIMMLDLTNQRVGIGTDSPKQPISLNNGRVSIDVRGDYYGAWIDGDSSGTSAFNVGRWHNAGGRMRSGGSSDNDLVVETQNTSHNLQLQPSGGKVGVGDDDPVVKLHVKGSGNSHATLNVHTSIEDTTSYAANVGGLQVFEGRYNSANSPAVFSAIHGGKENATDGNYAGYLRFLTRAHGAMPVEVARIASNGFMGVKTPDPQTELNVIGTVSTGRNVARELGTIINISSNPVSYTHLTLPTKRIV